MTHSLILNPYRPSYYKTKNKKTAYNGQTEPQHTPKMLTAASFRT